MEGEGDAFPEEIWVYHPWEFGAEDKVGARGDTRGGGTQPRTPSPVRGPLSAVPHTPGGRGRMEPSLTFEVQRERDALILQPVDELAAVASLVLQSHVGDGERGIVAVAVPQAHPRAQGSVVFVVQPVGDDDDVLPVVGRFHFAPLHPVVAGQGAQDAGQGGRGAPLRVHGGVEGLQQVLQARGGCGTPGAASASAHRGPATPSTPSPKPLNISVSPSWFPSPIPAPFPSLRECPAQPSPWLDPPSITSLLQHQS